MLEIVNTTKKRNTTGQKLFLSLLVLFPLVMGAIGIYRWYEDFTNDLLTRDWREVSEIVNEKSFDTHMTSHTSATGSSIRFYMDTHNFTLAQHLTRPINNTMQSITEIIGTRTTKNHNNILCKSSKNIFL